MIELTEHAYPKDISQKLGEPTLLGQMPGPSRLEVECRILTDDERAEVISTQEKLIEEVFFASLATEEGKRAHVGVVYIEDTEKASKAEPGFGWHVFLFEKAQPCDVEHLTKLSPLCRKGESYLVATGTGETLRIVGWASSPSSFEFTLTSLAPKYLRITVVGPGELVFECGDRQVLRTRSGRIIDSPPSFFVQVTDSEPRCTCMKQIYKNSEIDPFHCFRLDEALQLMMEAVTQTDGGGMLLFRPTADWHDDLLTIPHRLKTPIDLAKSIHSIVETGYRIRVFHEEDAWGEMTLDRKEKYRRAEQNEHAAWEATEQLCTLIGRLAHVDGAVAISSDLQVLGFGAKVAVADVWRPPRVLKAVHYERDKWEEFDLNGRGTRHRAAVCFADQSDCNLALVVSHDGDAAALFKDGNDVVYWPIRLRPHWSGGGILD